MMAREEWEAVEVYSEKEIAAHVDEMAWRVHDFYGPINNLLVLGVLTGSFVFMADFTRALGSMGLPHEVAFMSVKSQSADQKSLKQPEILLDLQRPIDDMHVLLVDDIRDKGYTLEMLMSILEERNPLSLEILALFIKDDADEAKVPIRFKGLRIPKKYVEGYGLDDALENGRWRRNLIYWRQKGGVEL